MTECRGTFRGVVVKPEGKEAISKS